MLGKFVSCFWYSITFNIISEKNRTKYAINETIFCDCLPECTDVTFNGYVNTAKSSTEKYESNHGGWLLVILTLVIGREKF